jgi:hypothetical protein
VSYDITHLYNLLPAVYRQRDTALALAQNLLTPAELNQLQTLQAITNPTPVEQAELAALLAKQQMGPLQSLLMVIGEQAAAVEANVEQLYDDLFIETCAPWVIPYIGDLIGYKSVVGAAPGMGDPRSDVANTIALRRRKGTATMLEQLARDVTDWTARAVEFFELLGTTQYMNHTRPGNFYAPDLRNWQPLAYEGTAFDSIPRTVDVRRIEPGRGRYNLPNIGIFLWSLTSYPAASVTPAKDILSPVGYRYRMSPLGNDMPLFINPVEETEVTQIAQPQYVAAPLKTQVLFQDFHQVQVGGQSLYYGSGNSVALYQVVSTVVTPTSGQPYGTVVPTLIAPSQIIVTSLADGSPAWNNPDANKFQLDPETGRFTSPTSLLPFPTQVTTSVPGGTQVATTSLEASYNYGFAGDMGGGAYPRSASFPSNVPVQLEVNNQDPAAQDVVYPAPSGIFKTITAAVDWLATKFNNSSSGETGVVEILNNGIYTENFSVDVAADCYIQLRSADETRATLNLGTGGQISVTGGANSQFEINGLLIMRPPALTDPALTAMVQVPAVRPSGPASQLAGLVLNHLTLVPGWALGTDGTPQAPNQAALIANLPGLQVNIDRSVVGSLLTNTDSLVSVTDSIVDATSVTGVSYASPLMDGPILGPGGTLSLTSCTVIGKIHAQALDIVSDSILLAQLETGDPWPAPVKADRRQEGGMRFSFLPAGSLLPEQYQCLTPGDNLWPYFTSLRYGSPGYGQMRPFTVDSIRRGADDHGEMGAFHFVNAPQRESDLLVRLTEYTPVGLEVGIFYET